jgi:hypothetical protein
VEAAPKRRSIVSMQNSALGSVLSYVGMTTRYRLQASQAENRYVSRPSTFGSFPQSYWTHIPGSEIQGRSVRRWPAR